MKIITETFLVAVSGLLWLIVLPLAGLVEIGVALSERIRSTTIHRGQMATAH